MFKKLAATAVTILSLGGVASASSVDDIVNASYMLRENGTPICSAQFVSENVLLTAAHCVADSTGKAPNKEAKYTVTKQKINDKYEVLIETVYALEVLKFSHVNDVATLKVKDGDTKFPYVDVATQEEADSLEILDQTVAATFHISKQSTDLTFTPGVYNGVIKAPLEWKPEDEVISTTAESSKGSSGGGLYAKFDGEWKLIATVEGGVGSPVHLYSTTDSIIDILKNGTGETAKEILSDK